MSEPLRRRVRARLLNGMTRVAASLPRPVVSGTLRQASRLARFTRYERLALANLELALPELSAGDRRRIARGVRRHSARLMSEWLLMSSARVSGPDRHQVGLWIDSTVELDASLTTLDNLVARGRGAIVVTGHLGNWELLAAALRRRGYRGAVVGYRKHNDSTALWFVELRAAQDVESLSQSSPPRRVLEVLRAGGTLGLLVDLEVRRIASEFLPFFGRPALTMTSPAALARASGLPLVPARCVAVGDHYRLSVEPPLHLDRTLERKAAARDLMTRVNAQLERWIRETPEQWAWHQPRWRSSPEEGPAREADSRSAEWSKPHSARRRPRERA